AGAGDDAVFSDAALAEVGAVLEADPAALAGSSDLLLKVTAPTVGILGADLSAEAEGAEAETRPRASGSARWPNGGSRHFPPMPFLARRERSRWTRCRRWPTSPATRACCSRQSRSIATFPC